MARATPPGTTSAAPPSAAGPSEPPAAEEQAPAVHTAEDRQRLKAALDELVACRQIIETALAQG